MAALIHNVGTKWLSGISSTFRPLYRSISLMIVAEVLSVSIDREVGRSNEETLFYLSTRGTWGGRRGNNPTNLC
jgi:hypothetical protein